MSINKKTFLVIFALFIVGINIALYSWAQSFKAEEVPYLKDVKALAMNFDSNGNLWLYIQTASGNELRVYENDKLTNVYPEPGEGGAARYLLFDSANRFWVVRHYGSIVFNDEKWKSFRYLDGLKDSIAIDAEGNPWFGTVSDGLFIFDGKSTTQYTIENSGLLSNDVSDIAFEDEGLAWITTAKYRFSEGEGGVNTFDGREWNAYTSENSPLTSDIVDKIAFDEQNRVWISSRKEINVFDNDEWVRYPINENSETDIGFVFSMVFDGQGRAWINHTRVFDEKIWKFYIDPFHSGVYDTTADTKGNIWISTDNGVVIIRPDSLQPIPYETGMVVFAIASGGLAYLTILLLVAWISIAFNTWDSIGFSLLGLPIYIIWILANISSVYLNDLKSYNIFAQNPAIIGTIGGIIGGAIEISLKKQGNMNVRRWGLLGFAVGTVMSFCAIILPNFFVQ